MSDAVIVKDITKQFHNGTTSSKKKETNINNNSLFTALDNVSFTIKKSSTVVIGGANGSGKSVLMSIIAQLSNPTTGTVSTDGRVGLIFQDTDTQILGETPEEDIAFGLKNTKVPKQKREKIIQDMIQKTGLSHRKGFPARFLSGGEKRRLAVAGILAVECPTIIFDEPYANLDYEGVQQVNALICMLQREQKTVIILTHELEKCLALADHFLILYNGKLVFNGTPHEGLKQPLENWKIRNPLTKYSNSNDLVWL
ncbi:MAG: cobalt ABC transporter ATP-binding protein [Treponema sp. CETP13]|nr:MAG: cobalt ABC transporter ATP-binding protein [Treponema sp. CETP13]